MKSITLSIIFFLTTSLAICSHKNFRVHECPSKCQSCQDTIVNLKSNNIHHCKEPCANFCEAVKVDWTRQGENKAFQEFAKDHYGKCHACYRAGYCDITECEAQLKKEEQVITQVVNAYQFDAKLPPSVLIPMAHPLIPEAQMNSIKKENEKIKHTIETELEDASKIKSATNVLNEVLALNKNIAADPLSIKSYKKPNQLLVPEIKPAELGKATEEIQDEVQKTNEKVDEVVSNVKSLSHELGSKNKNGSKNSKLEKVQNAAINEMNNDKKHLQTVNAKIDEASHQLEKLKKGDLKFADKEAVNIAIEEVKNIKNTATESETNLSEEIKNIKKNHEKNKSRRKY